jgi:hypothetical protein
MAADIASVGEVKHPPKLHHTQCGVLLQFHWKNVVLIVKQIKSKQQRKQCLLQHSQRGHCCTGQPPPHPPPGIITIILLQSSKAQ